MSLDYTEYLSLVQVRPDDIDLFGHVHSAKYLDYFLAARFEQMQKNYLCGMDEFLSKGLGWFLQDYDISFKPDTLVKMLSHDKDIVTGIYRQRNMDNQILEVFEPNDRGGFTHIPWDKIKNTPLAEVGACGFGCVLIKKKVMVDIGYPQFKYHSALNHAETFSEDLDFCRKAREKGFKLFADTSIVCEHTGKIVFKVQ